MEGNDAWDKYKYHAWLRIFIEPWIYIKRHVCIIHVFHDGFIEKYIVLA